MIFCTRCARNWKKCRFSFLFRRCAKCIRVEKKCEFFESIVNFNDIDKFMRKLKREKLKIKIVWKATNEFVRSKLTKLKRLRQQKQFFRKNKQKMFDKILNDVKKLIRLKNLKRANKMTKMIISFFFFNFCLIQTFFRLTFSID